MSQSEADANVSAVVCRDRLGPISHWRWPAEREGARAARAGIGRVNGPRPRGKCLWLLGWLAGWLGILGGDVARRAQKERRSPRGTKRASGGEATHQRTRNSADRSQEENFVVALFFFRSVLLCPTFTQESGSEMRDVEREK